MQRNGRRCEYDNATWIDPEEVCYPSGGMHRNGRARCADGSIRAFRAGIPDTYFSIPATRKVKGRTVRGWVGVDTDTEPHGTLVFHDSQPTK